MASALPTVGSQKFKFHNGLGHGDLEPSPQGVKRNGALFQERDKALFHFKKIVLFNVTYFVS